MWNLSFFPLGCFLRLFSILFFFFFFLLSFSFDFGAWIFHRGLYLYFDIRKQISYAITHFSCKAIDWIWLAREKKSRMLRPLLCFISESEHSEQQQEMDPDPIVACNRIKEWKLNCKYHCNVKGKTLEEKKKSFQPSCILVVCTVFAYNPLFLHRLISFMNRKIRVSRNPFHCYAWLRLNNIRPNGFRMGLGILVKLNAKKKKKSSKRNKHMKKLNSFPPSTTTKTKYSENISIDNFTQIVQRIYLFPSIYTYEEWRTSSTGIFPLSSHGIWTLELFENLVVSVTV